MKLRNINVIIAREYLNKVKKKSFLVTTFLVPVLIVAIYAVMLLIMFKVEDKGKQVAIIDRSGIVMPYMESNKSFTFADCSGSDFEQMKSTLADSDYDAILLVSPLDSVSKTVSASAYSVKPISMDLKDALARRIDDAVEDYRLSTYNIDDLKQIIQDVKSDVSISTYTLDEKGGEKISSAEVYSLISMILGMIIYIFIALFCGMIMQSVIEEKSSRVVEVLMSSVKSIELMFGKIIGVALVALTQFALWIVLSLVLIGGISAFVGTDKLMDNPEMSQQMMDMATMGMDQQTLDASGMNIDPTAVVAMASEEDGGLAEVLDTLKGLNYGLLFASFFIYFILGYLLYASLFAAIGSSVENEADSQQLQLPLTIPLMLGFFIAFYAFKAPDSAVVFWGSMIPFTSPIVMLARIPYGVASWEIILSIVLLVATFFACAWVSAKIYRTGILMYGKKTTFKDLWRWLRMK